MSDVRFPRGGRKIIPNENKKRQHKPLFDENQPKKKKIRHEEPETVTEESWEKSLKFNGTLTYQKLQSGMVVLGCIRNISDLSLQVELPGLLFAQVPVNAISECFTKSLLQKLQNEEEDPTAALNALFKVGSFVMVKITSIDLDKSKNAITASINPTDVNSDKSHNYFKKGSTVWASVLSEQDHGYQLTVGVHNCRVFLPFARVNQDTKYAIGQPLFCVIHKADVANNATTLTVSAKQEHINKVTDSELTLLDIVPGMSVHMTIEKILANGIKGKFLENYMGYIDDTQFFSRVKLQELQEDTIIQAYVLFTEPITKVTYLTLRPVDDVEGPELDFGVIMPATVVSHLSRGMGLKLDKTHNGFITMKRLMQSLPSRVDLDMRTFLQKKYPIGSKHKCRVLNFSVLSQSYICTFEKAIIDQKMFNLRDLKMGQKVDVKIQEINAKGLVVTVGNVRGFVPNFHLSQTQYSDNIKSKFSVGMDVKARVLIIKKDTAIFTLKQGLIESDQCLVELQDASVGQQYAGFVIDVKTSGAVVSFYGDIRGFISTKSLNLYKHQKYIHPTDYFFRGQVVHPWIVRITERRPQLSLHSPDDHEAAKDANKNKKTVPIEEEMEVEEEEEPEEETVDEEEEEESADEEQSAEELENDSESEVEDNETVESKPLLSGMNAFLDSDEEQIQDQSSSDEEIDTPRSKQKKKKLTVAERAKQEEERISKIENELADANLVPTCADHFDRLVLAKPNSSELWLKYIAMHLANTELNKARNVARRALEKINATLIQERFNVWVALLNLENLYGTKDSFNEIFEEAVRCNDSLDIFLCVIKMLAMSGKLSEMEEKIKKVRSKEKQSIKMWMEIGQVYYTLGQFKEARNMKEAALKSILDRKRQFDLIIKFGIMEFRYGELEDAIANFETILETYPSKIHIWVMYVEQLLKKNKTDEARKVLERVTNLKMAPKHMKVAFQKYIKIEEEFGTPESVEEVKKKAKAYVSNAK